MEKRLCFGAMAAVILMLTFGMARTKMQEIQAEPAKVPEMFPGVIVTEAEPAMRTWTLEKSGAGEALVKVTPYVKPTVEEVQEPEVFEDFFNEDRTAFALKRYLEHVGAAEVEEHTLYTDPTAYGVLLPSGDIIQVTLVGKMTMPQITVNRPNGRTYRADLRGEGELILVDDVHEKYVHEDTLWTLEETIETLAALPENRCPFVETGVTHWEYPTFDTRVQSLHED